MARLLANGLAQVAIAFAIAWLVRRALAGVSAEGAVTSPPVIAGLVAAGLLRLALRALERVDAERLGQDYVMKVRLRLFERIAQRPARHERAERFGLTMTRMVTDLSALRNWVSVGVARMAVASVCLVGVLATLAFFDAGAALVVGGVLLLCAGIALTLTPRLRARVREARRRRGRLAGNMGEKVFAFHTVRHHGRTRHELRRLRRQSRRMTDALVMRTRAVGVLRALPDAAFPLTAAALVVMLAWRGAAGSVRHELVVTLLLLGMLMSSLRDLLQAWDYRLSFEEGRRRIGELLDGPRIREALRAGALAGEGAVAVALRGVCVGGVLDGASAAAEPGDRVLLTGPAGSGKSTVVGLLARLFEPEAGEILLDGRRLQALSLESLGEGVRLVSPELPLLRGTVGTNLAYGAGDEAPESLTAAAALCGLDASDAGLPRGLDTPVREQGSNLSASLRSRVSLARALAATPRLLLIDDPVFLADAAARAALERVLGLVDATVFVVAPEAEALPGIDRIWHLEHGRVLERRPAPELRVLSGAPDAPSRAV